MRRHARRVRKFDSGLAQGLPLVAALRDRGARTVQWALPGWEAECAKAGGEFRVPPDVGIDLDRPPRNLIGAGD
jgi:hypothetical protein